MYDSLPKKFSLKKELALEGEGHSVLESICGFVEQRGVLLKSKLKISDLKKAPRDLNHEGKR